MIEMIAHCLHLVHNGLAPETSGAGFSSPKLQAGRTANPGGIFTSHAIAPSMGGMVGSRKARRVPVAGLLTRHCRPPRLAAGSGQPLLQEATDMATTHTPIQTAHAAGAEAARAWHANPIRSIGFSRDLALAEFIAQMNFSIEKLPEIDAFEQGFSAGLVEAVFGGVRHA